MVIHAYLKSFNYFVDLYVQVMLAEKCMMYFNVLKWVLIVASYSLGAVQQSKPSASEAEIKKYMGSYLRSAPDRCGGMGRQKGKSAIDVCSDSE